MSFQYKFNRVCSIGIYPFCSIQKKGTVNFLHRINYSLKDTIYPVQSELKVRDKIRDNHSDYVIHSMK